MSSRAPKSATFIANGAKHKLNGASRHQRAAFLRERALHATFASVARKARSCSSARMFRWATRAVTGTAVSIRRLPPERKGGSCPARKSVVSGKSVAVRVDLGGRRILTKKNNTEHVN